MLFSNLSKTYKGKYAVKDASIELQAGSIHGLLGANGAGKSTLIKMLLGLVVPDSVPSSDDLNMQAKKVAYLPEHSTLPTSLTAVQIVSHAAWIRTNTPNTASETLSRVGLDPEYWNKPVRTYSKGMLQRTAIAYALAGDIDWLILDEPMSGLDALGRKEMLDVFMDIRNGGIGILMCSHSVPDLVRACDTISIMAKGVICETVNVVEHTLEEGARLEARLAELTGSHVHQ